jgi:multiple sugar transport system substrate-binding protein
MDPQRRARGKKILTVGATLLVGLLAACSSSSSTASSSSSGSTNNSTNGNVTVSIMVSQQIRAQALQKLIPQFEAAMAAKGQHITVKLVQDIVPDNNYQTLLTEDYNAGTAPDIADFGISWLPDFGAAGYLLNLKPYLQQWSGWSSFYPSVVSQAQSADGSMYALVHEASTQQIFYRADILAKDGISTAQPQTWNDLIARLQQIKAKTGQPAIIIPAGTAWASPEQGLYNVLLGTGSQLYDSKTGKWVVSSAGLTYTYNLLATLKNDGLIPTQDLLNPNPWQPTKYVDFPKGTTPVSFQGTWGWSYDWGPTGTAPIPDLTTKVKTWDFPAETGSPFADASDGHVWAVAKNTKNPQAATELIEWLSTGSALAQQLVAVGAASPRSGMDSVAPYSDHPELLQAEQGFSTAKAMNPESNQDKVDQAFETAATDVLEGRDNGTQAAALFAQQAKVLLGPNNVEG